MCKKTTSESYQVRVGKEKEAYRILKSDLLYVEIFFLGRMLNLGLVV